MKKILVICARGNSRSVALAYVFKDYLQQDAIAIGIEAANKDTKQMLFKWAEKIILVAGEFEEKLRKEIPKKYIDKLLIWNVGGDRFFRGFEPELLEIYKDYIKIEGDFLDE